MPRKNRRKNKPPSYYRPDPLDKLSEAERLDRYADDLVKRGLVSPAVLGLQRRSPREIAEGEGP